MAGEDKTDWRELCKAASQEQDPSRLLELVRKLNDALTQREVSKAAGLRSNSDLEAG